MNERIKNGLGLLGDLASVLTIPVIAWGWFTVKQEIVLNRTQSESAAKDAYVQKSDFTEAMRSLTDTDRKLADNARIDEMNIQRLSDIVLPRRETYNKPN